MKKFSFLISIIVAIIAIYFLEPIINEAKENNKFDFTLETIDGPLKKDDLKGKALGIYFGYMYCPDVCPTSLSSLSAALKTFSPEQQAMFTGLFISVDPERDTLKNLKEYSQYFHPTFIGATSTKENLDEITSNYKSFYEMVTLKGSQMGYSVSHTSYIYIFDKEGNFVAMIDHFTNPKEIKETLEKVL